MVTRPQRWAVVLLFLIAGCNNNVPPPAVTVATRPVDMAGFDDAIKQLHGKVVVVDFWQTSCVTCVYEFPELVKLHDRFAGQEVATLSMNLDDPDGKNVEEKVLGFLNAKKADFTNLRLAKGQKPEEWMNKRLKLEDGLPGQCVYDRDGKLVQTFSGGGDYPDISDLVGKILKRGSRRSDDDKVTR